jgi:hypothetical protein
MLSDIVRRRLWTMFNSTSAWRAAVLQASLACIGASCSGDSAIQACPSLQSLPECTAERSDYGTPQVILSADELGTGFLLSFVNEAVVVGQRDGEFRGVLVDGQLPRIVFDLEFQGTQGGLRVQDAAWEGWRAIGTPRFYVLACVEESCELYQTSQVDEFGLPLGPVQPLDTPLERGWSVHGLFFPSLETSALCAYGHGIRCLSDSGWVESLSRTESGDITQVLSGLALSVDGRLFRLDQQASSWTEVPGVSNVARLTTRTRFDMRSRGSRSGWWQKPVLGVRWTSGATTEPRH